MNKQNVSKVRQKYDASKSDIKLKGVLQQEDNGKYVSLKK